MPQLPLYQQQAGLAEGPRAVVAPLPMPPADPNSLIGAAVEHFGEAGMRFAAQLQEAAGQSAAARSTTAYIVGLDGLRKQYANDSDHLTVADRFEADRKRIEDGALEAINDPVRRERLREEFTRLGISARARAETTALGNAANDWSGNTSVFLDDATRRSAAAVSPGERVSIYADVDRRAAEGVAAGYIDAAKGEAIKRSIRRTADEIDADRLIKSDPVRAKAALESPDLLPGLDPLRRQQLLGMADHAAQGRTVAALETRARFEPVRGILETNRVVDPDQVDSLLEKVVKPIESDGRTDLVGPLAAGGVRAVGAYQITPDAARDAAKRLGRADLAALDDAALSQRILADPALQRKLARSEMTWHLARYDGNVAVALASYNAGPRNADRWLAQAREKFGADVTPAEFASVVDFKETRNYLAKAWKIAGADDTVKLPADVAMRAGVSIWNVHRQDQAERAKAIRDFATDARAAYDPSVLMQDGITPDPEGVAAWKRAQAAARDTGDLAAGRALAKVELQERLLPEIQDAYASPPAALERKISTLEAALAAGPLPASSQMELVALRDALQHVRSEMDTAAKAEPLALPARAGRPPAPLPLDAAPNDRAFADGLSARGQQALAAAATYGAAPKPFLAAEAAQLKTRFEQAGENEQLGLLAAMGRGLPEPAYRAALAQLGLKGNQATAGLVAARDPELAGLILHGEALIAQHGVKPGATDVRTALASQLGGELYLSPQMQGEVVDAAIAVYAAQRGASKALYDPTDGAALERALERVTGELTKVNGVKVAAPRGMRASAFASLWDGLTDADVDGFGGAFDGAGQAVTSGTLRDRAVLRQLTPGDSRYAVGLPSGQSRDGFAPLLDRQGMPLVVDAGIMAAALKGRAPGLWQGVRRGLEASAMELPAGTLGRLLP